jgi:hypothetical protein
VCYRLIDPGSEWRLHRQWFEQSAMADLPRRFAGAFANFRQRVHEFDQCRLCANQNPPRLRPVQRDVDQRNPM